MIIFFTIAVIAFLYVLITSIAGHAHDLGSDIIHGDLGHDDDGGDNGHITSIFSSRVIATFLMGFGATGGVAKFYNFGYDPKILDMKDIAQGIGPLGTVVFFFKKGF